MSHCGDCLHNADRLSLGMSTAGCAGMRVIEQRRNGSWDGYGIQYWESGCEAFQMTLSAAIREAQRTDPDGNS